MTASQETIKQLMDEIVQMLKDDGWRETKLSHYRKEDMPIAIEVGYVYGECTVRFQQLGGQSGQVDVGTIHTMRGHDINLKIELASQLEQIALSRGVNR